MVKLFALIRANFNINPETLSDEEFARLASEAEWLERFRGEVLKGAIAEVLYTAFGGGKTT